MTTTFSGVLRYDVPDHQGQEVLGAALVEHGYAWTSDFVRGRTVITITAPDGGTLDRERVRDILSEQHRASLSGPDIIYTEVRFEDEPSDFVPPRHRAPVSAPPAEPSVAPTVVVEETPASARPASLIGPLVRAAVGAALLTFPRRITDALIPDADEGDRVVARLLGARHLVQAVVTAARPTPAVLAAGAAADAAHGATALGYALLRPDHRGAALLSSSVAFTFAAADLRRAHG